ncbi:hypothetical protein PCNPT3_11190 [Psychromonas sp. CNPT3]|uniref:hypothetical protein n=1 Tax=Psychromonas sp. CNPT3 TaxID=314282 RepID=UPI00006E9EB6|nr:hypothetical protein [Psychromonas sp. CNPT3]AGH82174.1 hypothetical protein PCNPT3_11190 [Psychromonas sp. CNPT3]
MRYFILFIGVFLLNGCASIGQSKVNVSIDSILSTPLVSQKTYVLNPGNVDTFADDLQFKEYSRYVVDALKDLGYHLATDAQHAEVEILLAYGIGKPQTKQYSYSVPRLGYGSFYSGSGRLHRKNNALKLRRSFYRPYYADMGYRDYEVTQTTFVRYIVLSAYSLSAKASPSKDKQLWVTRISSEGESDDLRLVFPFLITGAKPYIATDTGHKISVSMVATASAQ